MSEFMDPELSIGHLDVRSVASVISAAGDIALIVDADGRVVDLAVHNEGLAHDLDDAKGWLGRVWIDLVTPESRAKIQTALRNARGDGAQRQVFVNHPSRGPVDLPIQYALLPLGGTGRVVALGRDQRKESQLQQQLVDAQQSLERDYLRLRHVETRYRLLFEVSAEAVVVLDAASQKIVEANPVARALLGGEKPLPGRSFGEFFDAPGAQAIASLLTIARLAGRAEDVRARLAGAGREVAVSASLFRQENTSLYLVRLSTVQVDGPTVAANATKSKLLLAVESAPDGFVVTGPDGRIVAANAAFVDMVQLASEEQVRGQTLDQWLGRSGVDLGVLTSKLEQWGSVRLFATTLRGAYGATADVEISAVSVQEDNKDWAGFAIRDVGRRLPADSRVGRELPRSVEQLTELIGRVALKDLVREATDMIERLCIEAALELTSDNRASAAELLGLSRQSLYLKLRRHGLGDLGPEPEQKH